jgi:hypothetical protein
MFYLIQLPLPSPSPSPSHVSYSQSQYFQIQKLAYITDPFKTGQSEATLQQFQTILGAGKLIKSDNGQSTYLWQDTNGRQINAVFDTTNHLLRWTSQGF